MGVKDCEELFMDHSNVWDANQFQLLFDDSTPPNVEGIKDNVIPTSTSSLLEVLVSYSHLTFSHYGDDLLHIDGSIYVDPRHQVGNLEHQIELSQQSSSTRSQHQHVDMGPRFMDEFLGLLQHCGQPLYLGPWFLILLPNLFQNTYMGSWFEVVHIYYNN